MLWKIKKSFGKHNCILFAIMFLLLSICLFFFIPFLDQGAASILSIIMSIVSFIMFFVMLAAAFEEDPDYPPVFFHTLDDKGKHISVSGEKKLTIDEEGDNCSKQALTQEKSEDNINYWLKEQLILHEMELEDAGKEVTPKRKLQFLKKLFNQGSIEREDYKREKDVVISIDLDDFLSEIDMQEYDEETAYRRKINYIDALFSSNLIDTEEYEEIKTEIQENWEEENL